MLSTYTPVGPQAAIADVMGIATIAIARTRMIANLDHIMIGNSPLILIFMLVWLLLSLAADGLTS